MAESAPTPLARAAQAYRDHLAVERGLAVNSLAAYGRDLRRYLEFCAARGITDVTQVGEADLGDFLAWLRQGSAAHPPLSAASAARTLVAVRGFHRFALREGMAASDPGREVRPPAAAKRLPKALTVDEVTSILNATGGEICACDLVVPLGRSQPTVSHHLKVLREAGLITATRRGTNIWYAARPEQLDALRGVLGPATPTA